MHVSVQNALFAHRNGFFKKLCLSFFSRSHISLSKKVLEELSGHFLAILSSSLIITEMLLPVLLIGQGISGSCVQGHSPRPNTYTCLPATPVPIPRPQCLPSFRLGALLCPLGLWLLSFFTAAVSAKLSLECCALRPCPQV